MLAQLSVSKFPTPLAVLMAIWGEESDDGELSGCHFVVDGKFNAHPVVTIAEALMKAAQINQREENAYFACGEFINTGQGRKAENVAGARCVWLDIDCGAGKPYAEQKLGLLAIQQFCDSINLPKPSIVISSGNGLHVYWHFDELIPKDDWLMLAGQLKAVCKQHQLFADPSRTSDIASLLRMPGTKNWKDAANPKEVRAIRVGNAINLMGFKSALQSALPALPVIPVTDGLNSVLAGNSQLEESSENIKRVSGMLSHIDPDCAYDLWRNLIWSVLSTRWECSEQLARDWSRSGGKWDAGGFRGVVDSFDASRGITLGTLVHHAELAGWRPTAEPIAATINESKFRLRTVADLKSEPQQQWRVKHLLPEQGLAAIYGASGSGKSFLALELLARIATGRDFFGYKVEPCPVVYVALEGAAGTRKRLQVWEKYNGVELPDSFRIVTDPLSLLNNDALALSAAIKIEGVVGGVVVIDTLNQAAPGADENSSKDMGILIANAKVIQREAGALVILIHHSGKDASRGARGHSSFVAALDAAIAVEGEGLSRSWRCAKSKDDQTGAAHPFRLGYVSLGVDPDGDEITSCVAVPDTNRVFQLPLPRGENQRRVLATLREQFRATNSIPMEAALGAATSVLSGKNRRQRAKESIDGLLSGGYLRNDEGGLSLISDCLET